jgi:ABC-type nitrate/sulfonate/bicarbonate transport system substrate-binding protein
VRELLEGSKAYLTLIVDALRRACEQIGLEATETYELRARPSGHHGRRMIYDALGGLTMSRASGFGTPRRSALKALGVGALILAAPRRSGGQAKLQKMSLFTGTVHFGNVIVAQEKGFFEREGLPIEITSFSTGTAAAEAFQAGRGNTIASGDQPALRLWVRGAGVGICPVASYGHVSVVVARKGISAPSGLRGKKVGVLLGSTSDYFARLYLASGKIDPKEVDLINLQAAEMVTGIVRGDIDAFVGFEPFGTRAVQASTDVYIVTTGEKYFTEWLMTSATPEYARTNEAELVAYVRGLHAASLWCNQNREETAQIVAKHFKIDIAVVKQTIDPINWTVAYTPKFRADMDRMSEFLKLKLDWGKMFDVQPLKKADPSLAA